MTTPRLPGSDAARHGTGEADLTLMIAAHEAFRRDLVSLASAASGTWRSDPARQRSVSNGWKVFKRQLHGHHTGEDRLLWPKLAERLAGSEGAMSVLGEMEEEHARIDPLLAAVDGAFTEPAGDRLADTVAELTSVLRAHLAHEERDALPLIGRALTAGEWSATGRAMGQLPAGQQGGLSFAGEFFAWILDGAPQARTRAVLGQLPLPARLIYRMAWQPRYRKVNHW